MRGHVIEGYVVYNKSWVWRVLLPSGSWGQSTAFDAVIGPFAAFYGLNVNRPRQRFVPKWRTGLAKRTRKSRAVLRLVA